MVYLNFCGCLCCVVYVIKERKFVVKVEPIVQAEPGYMYKRKPWIVTKTEKKFFLFLQSVYSGFFIFPKVSASDVVDGIDSVVKGSRARISQKHFDFVVCNPDLKILCVIELDDDSHRQKSAQKNDAVKDEVLQAVGVPLLRVKVSDSYDRNELLQFLSQSVKGEITEEP